MNVRETAIPDLLLLEPGRHGDARGFFCETWSAAAFRAAGIPTTFVQDNQSRSCRTGTLRGLHCQGPPFAQAKLVRCGRGALLDVAVDIRAGSPHYGQHVSVLLSAENGLQLYIPDGFLHGFVTRAPDTEILYKCSAPYAAAYEHSVRWDSLGIDWGLTAAPVLSDRDAGGVPFDRFRTPFRQEVFA